MHTKIIPLNFSPSLKPEEEGNKRGKRREKLKMNELRYLPDKIATRPSVDKRTKGNFLKNFRARFPGFLSLLVCHDASSEFRFERIMVSILEYFTRQGVERTTFGIGNRVKIIFKSWPRSNRNFENSNVRFLNLIFR